MSSNLIRINEEHVYKLPDFPISQEEVLYVKESRDNQYWRKQTDYPKIWFDYIPGFTKENSAATIYNQDDQLISISKEDTDLLVRLLNREMQRRRDGVWFMNNGELTYLTGNHYFFLQWAEMHGYINPATGLSFGEYREFQRDLAYFVDLVENDPICAGGYIGKAKKTGATQFFSSGMYLNEATSIKEKRFTMMSKSLPDARDTNMMLFQHSLNALPMILKPMIKNQNLTKVIFDKPRTSTSGSMRQLLLSSASRGAGFKTSVEALPTKEDAMDGPKIYRAWLDEFMKYKAPYPQNVFDKSSEATKLQHQIIGKQFLTCYPPEDNSKGYFQSKKLWYECAMDNLSAMGQTQCGLYKHFMGALNATEGTIDKFGKADKGKAHFQNQSRRDAVKGNRGALQRLKRQYPETVKEMWESGGSGSTWDNIRIAAQIDHLETEEKLGAQFFRIGDLEWTNGFMSSVRIIEQTDEETLSGKEHKWQFYTKLGPDDVNRPFKPGAQRDFDNNLMPDPNTPFGGAVDPTDYKEKSDVVEGSKNSITVMSALDSVKNSRYADMVTGTLVAEYYYRDDDPDVTLDDVVKAILFFGMYVIVEANKGWLVTKLKKLGLQHFLLIKDKSTGMIRPYQEGDELVLISTTTDMINEYCRAIARYIAKPYMDGDIDWLKYIKSVRLLRQMMDFDPLNTKIYDMVVSFGYCRLAIEAMAYVRQMNQERDDMYNPDLMKGILDKIINM